ncbi:hypothetical protein EBX93_16230, partial [bacterium]|nr:hypothetical protein [bacterium]
IALGATTLGADSSITTADQTIGMTSVVGNNYDLTLNSGTAATTVTGTVSGVDVITVGTDVAGTLGSYTFSGNVSANDLVTVGTNREYDVTLSGSSVNIASNVNFTNNGVVTLGDGGSDSQVYGGGFTHNVNTTQLGGNISTTDDAVSLGAVTLLANTTINTAATTNAADITLGNVTGDFNLGLTAGNVDGANVTVNSFASAGNLTLGAAGAATFGNINAGIVTISDALNSVTFNGQLNATTLSVAAGTSNYNVALNGATNITNAVTFNNAGTLALGDGGDTLTFNGGLVATAPSVTLDGTIQTSGDVITLGSSSKSITVNGDSSLSSNSGVAAGANINLNGTVNSQVAESNALTVNAGTSGNITIAQNVGATQALSDLDLTGATLNINAATINLNGGAGGATSTWTGATVLGANGITIAAGGNNLNLNGTVNADDAAAYDRTLTVTSTGTVTLGGSIGASQALADLDITASQINLDGASYQINDNNSAA